jgi:hypothetical protein
VPLVDLIRNSIEEENEDEKVRNMKEGEWEEKEQLHHQQNQEQNKHPEIGEGRPPEHNIPVLRTPIKSPHEEQRELATSFMQSATPGKQHTAVEKHHTAMEGKSFITVITSPPEEADYEVSIPTFLAASLPVCASASLILYCHACLTTGLSSCLPVGVPRMEVPV